MTDTAVKKIDSEHSARGKQGQKYLGSLDKSKGHGFSCACIGDRGLGVASERMS
jgi:hypothetical protein